jgi:hypothetical protein
MSGVAELRMALDRAAFARAAGLEPDAWQSDFLSTDADRVMLNVSRQGGKSSLSALIGLHRALYYPGSLVLLLAPALRQSSELFRKVAVAYRALGRPVPAVSETTLWLTLENGSRIVSLPGADDGQIRGFSAVDLLIVDEAARVSDELYYAVRPMISVSGGRLLLLSTPWGRRGFFFREWMEGYEPWVRFEVPATQVPRIPALFLEAEKKSLGEHFFAQEYLTEFRESADQLFSEAEISGMYDPAVIPLFIPGEEPYDID